MKRYFILTICIAGMMLFSGCKNHGINKFKRQMKPLAEEYLANDKITDYDSLQIECIDTLSELSYAKLCSELLGNMENAYEMQLQQAYQTNDERAEYLEMYVGEVTRTLEDFEDLMNSGDLKKDGVLLYMVTGSYVNAKKQKEDFMFLVNPDKKTLHMLDPFGDNLLYKDEAEE
ncbi:MAG: hypothetical protein MJZ87_03890 [Bacteroidales bacterium]|nr:hypothetical protein [Bacteroidales bacterium]